MVTTITLDENSAKTLKALAKKCSQRLITATPIQFNYPENSSHNNWIITEIKELNSNLLGQLRHNGNLYALYTKQKNETTWELKYVGQTKSTGLRERITQHLISKNERTGSKLGSIKDTVSAGEEVALSYIKIDPESLKELIEGHIIEEKKPAWNIHS